MSKQFIRLHRNTDSTANQEEDPPGSETSPRSSQRFPNHQRLLSSPFSLTESSTSSASSISSSFSKDEYCELEEVHRRKPITSSSLSRLYPNAHPDMVRFSICFLTLAPLAWSTVLAWTPHFNPQKGNTVSQVLESTIHPSRTILMGRSTPSCSEDIHFKATQGDVDLSNRRAILATFATAAFTFATSGASNAFPEEAVLSSSSTIVSDAKAPTEFINVGTQAPAPDGSTPFQTLSNGVQIKDFKEGTGDTVTSRSQVQLQLSGRLLNLNGIPFYNTKNNNPDGFGAVPLTLQLGQGQALPGLESGVQGMKKGGIRRIIIPQDLAYKAFPDLEPQPTNPTDQRALDSVMKNPRRDGAILFDVQVERFK